MTETTYTVPGAPRLALLSDLHGRLYREIIVSASLSNTASPIPRLKESSPAYPKGGHDRCGNGRVKWNKKNRPHRTKNGTKGSFGCFTLRQYLTFADLLDKGLLFFCEK